MTPVGGQGFVLGRGNQQLSPRVLRAVGRPARDRLATDAKLAALRRPRRCCVDTGDRELDAALAGYARVVTGYGRTSDLPGRELTVEQAKERGCA